MTDCVVTGWSMLRQGAIATVAALLLLLPLALGGSAQALSLEESLTSAGQDYLSSILKDYAKVSQDDYGTALKQAQTLVNGLAEQLETAADPGTKAGDRTAILAKVSASKAALGDLATAFGALAADTNRFDAQLQASVEDVLRLVKGDVRVQLTQNEANFKTIAGTLTDLATTVGKADENTLSDLLGSVSDNITALNTALDTGSKALKTVSNLAK